jgi:hypothetical protein
LRQSNVCSKQSNSVPILICLTYSLTWNTQLYFWWLFSNEFRICERGI